MKAFEKLMAKKEASLPEGRQKARASVLDDLIGNMDDRESKKLGMKKVSVMSDSDEGLKQGLDKAQDVVEEAPEMDTEEMPEDGALEEHEEDDQMKMARLEAELEELKAKLAKLGV